MASSWPPVKNAAFTLPFHIWKNDGTTIANPGGLAGRIVCDAHPTGAATDAAPSVIDSTGGSCSIVLSQAEMNSDIVEVKVTSTDSGAVTFCQTIYTVAQTMDAVKAETALIVADTNELQTNQGN